MYETQRAERIRDQLKKLTVSDEQRVKEWKQKDGFFLNPEEAQKDKGAWKNFNSDKDRWGKKDLHAWFSTELEVPKLKTGERAVLEVRTDKDGWDAINPQMLVFINGAVAQGCDTNHRRVVLPSSAKGKIKLDIQAYGQREPADLQLAVSLFIEDLRIYNLYCDFHTAIESAKTLSDSEYNEILWHDILTQAVNMLDLREPLSKDFYTSVEKASEYFKKTLYKVERSNAGRKKNIRAACIGHTHIDIAWWWTVAQTREKAIRSFATVLKLMDEYPDYLFMSSQPFLYDAVKKRYPEVFERIKKQIKNKRWEPEGGMWVEADCNLPSGESFVRQFIHGKKFFKEEFGVDNKILWLPDVFGYSASLPQICKKCGIDYFMTTKITWSQINKLPYDTFNWKGIDGTELFTHFVTGIDYESQKEGHFTTYNGFLDPSTTRGAWERYQHKDINQDVLISYGHGDGGGGPTHEMLEHGKRLVNDLPGLPQLHQSFVGEYFDDLYKRVKNNKKLPLWAGELYLEYHRGTYTSMARNKRGNRKSEHLLQSLEFFASWAKTLGGSYPQTEIYDNWTTVLTNQFHDILPGSSIKEVYDVTKEEYEQIEKDCTALLQTALEFIADKIGGKGVRVFNTLSFERNDVIEIPAKLFSAKLPCNEEGVPLVHQKAANGSILIQPSIPARGSVLITVGGENTATSAKQANPFKITEKGIETKLYNIKLSKEGQITSFYDRKGHREVLPPKARANVFRLYEDKPIDYDNWDIEIYYREKSWELSNCTKALWTEKGPVRATYHVEYEISNCIIKQDIHFYANSLRVDFDTWVDWKIHQHLLKVEFPVDINTLTATCDIQFGNVQRPVHTNTSWDVARFEFCAHKWIDLSEGNYGASLLNDCKYGHSVHKGKMELTLIKSGILPNPDTDIEEHRFVYSFFPHTGQVQAAKTHEQAYMLNIPAYICKTDSATGKASANFIPMKADGVICETTKLSEKGDSFVLRAYEYKNSRGSLTLSIPKTFGKAFEADMLEKPGKAIPIRNDKIKLSFKPFEVKTILLKK
ncbi:alpha-mannosidase [Treponema phagedenis]|uniref:Glycosyl hydrolase family 38 N-terminal domain protein n=1 Tax=Treponema phagedenis TaxID=162 RepID=A0A0B7GWH8_TREPH|nr:alpha-mannosidase [Treponema phagedenis]QSH98790.1 alpha-mannosidase [Treponema phagedenis]CEM62878.1 Glycosyl hydrolase family 38 N-terminal domain protein [Treponema phagedenis]